MGEMNQRRVSKRQCMHERGGGYPERMSSQSTPNIDQCPKKAVNKRASKSRNDGNLLISINTHLLTIGDNTMVSIQDRIGHFTVFTVTNTDRLC